MISTSDSMRHFPSIIGPFPGESFSNRPDFEEYYERTADLRKSRWLYEQSLATRSTSLLTSGSCGICLCATAFLSSTRYGDQTHAGSIPNWREQMECACERALINRERALLHFLIGSGRLRPGLFVGLSGQQSRIANALHDFGVRINSRMARIEDADLPKRSPGKGLDLIISLEEMNRTLLDQEARSIANALAHGGAIVFTAPFLPGDRSTSESGKADVLRWSDLQVLEAGVFRRIIVTEYWSSEFGYLGPMNFIITCVK